MIFLRVNILAVLLVDLNMEVLCGCSKSKRKNVLLVVVDDLRPSLGCYGDPMAVTPNIDSFARTAVKFNNAYVQQALCGPSRTSFLTSRRPDTTCLYDVGSYWRKSAGNFTTLPQHFKDNGYYAFSIGKVFHPGIVSGHNDDMPYSWSSPAYHPPTEAFKDAPVCMSPFDRKHHSNIVCPVDPWTQPLRTLPDQQSLKRARQFLRERPRKQPFFLAVGFHKPHIPLKYPWDYLALHPWQNVSLAPDPTYPRKMPVVAWNPWNDLRRRDDIKRLNLSFPFGDMPSHQSRLIRQSYYAATSYIDDLFGQLLGELSDLELFNDTIVVLVGDHGWSLGEHQEWSKYSNFEISVRVPLLVHAPGITDVGGFKHISPFDCSRNKCECEKRAGAKETDALVELVDIFPTLSELAGLPVPKQCPLYSRKVNLCTEGTSLVQLMLDPKNVRLGKESAFSQYPRPFVYPSKKPDSDQPKLRDINIMGYSIRTRRFRYTEWVRFNHSVCAPNWSQVVATELYDHWNDPLEDHNLTDLKKYSGVTQKLMLQLRLGWKINKSKG